MNGYTQIRTGISDVPKFAGTCCCIFLHCSGFLGHVQSTYYRIYKDPRDGREPLEIGAGFTEQSTQDLAPKNELCDEFLFTSHVIEAWPKVVRLVRL